MIIRVQIEKRDIDIDYNLNSVKLAVQRCANTVKEIWARKLREALGKQGSDHVNKYLTIQTPGNSLTCTIADISPDAEEINGAIPKNMYINHWLELETVGSNKDVKKWGRKVRKRHMSRATGYDQRKIAKREVRDAQQQARQHIAWQRKQADNPQLTGRTRSIVDEAVREASSQITHIIEMAVVQNFRAM